ncbi:MAG: acyltransferase [Acidobacteria bacterium]|nr:acyltransferase [Acidobacteriota bacterium]
MPITSGQDCAVSIAPENEALLDRIFIVAGNRCKIEIGTIRQLGEKLSVYLADDCTLTIGDGYSCTDKANFTAHEPGCSIRVGRDCMIGSAQIWASDMHSIFDAETGVRINRGKNITICDHVWLGYGVMVLKGVTIGSGSIVGAMSCVRRDVPPNSMAAGNPARVLRSGVVWDSRLL